MEFKVIFGEAVLECPYKEFGLKKLDEAREEVGCKFPAEVFHKLAQATSIYPSDRRVYVSEETARASGKFLEQDIFQVTISKEKLEEYLYLKLHTAQKDTGEYVKVNYRWAFNAQEAIADWRDGGYSEEM